MTNPSPTDGHWLILYMVDDGEVFSDGVGGWRAKGPITFFRCNGAVRRLNQLGLIKLAADGTPSVTAEGMEVLKRRSIYDVLERIERRKRRLG